MASLFVANTSKQHQDFCYRLPEDRSVKMEVIRVGSQVRIGGDITSDTIQWIIRQHEPYGLKAVDELPRNSGFVGLCYSIGKPVQLDALHATFEQNDVAMNDRAEERREETVAAIASDLQTQMQERGTSVPRAEVEIVEDTRGTPNLASGYEVTQEGVAPRHGDRRSKKAARFGR